MSDLENIVLCNSIVQEHEVLEMSVFELAAKLDTLSISNESERVLERIPHDICAQWRTLKAIRKTMMSSTQGYQQFPKGLCVMEILR